MFPTQIFRLPTVVSHPELYDPWSYPSETLRLRKVTSKITVKNMADSKTVKDLFTDFENNKSYVEFNFKF